MKRQVVGIVLAAGASTRFGSPKQLAMYKGKPLVLHVVDALLSGGIERIFVVVGDGGEHTSTAYVESVGCQIEALVEETATAVFNKFSNEGLGKSIAVGVEAARDFECVAIALGDMPELRPATVRQLIAAFENAAPGAIVVPTFGDHQGHPVLFDGCYRDELLLLTGDRGARSIIQGHREQVLKVQVDDPGVLKDVDEVSDLQPGEAYGASATDA